MDDAVKAFFIVEKEKSMEEEKKPKGLEIRDKKRAKHNKTIRKVKEGQEDICRFIEIKYMTFQKVNGRTRPSGMVEEMGLQKSNKVYLPDGHFKYVNNKSLKIIKKYEGVPENAPENLKELYQNKIK